VEPAQAGKTHARFAAQWWTALAKEDQVILFINHWLKIQPA
jgi:hypothetical protein